MKLTSAFTVLGLSFGSVLAAHPALATTLEDVRTKDRLNCGVSQGLPGFSDQDDDGAWRGLDVDFCRAVAAAVLGDANKVSFKKLSASERFTALNLGEIDLLARNTTWTMSRDTTIAVHFVGVNFYDEQRMMMRKDQFEDLKASGDLILDGASVCTNTGTTTELNITDYFQSRGWDIDLVAIERSIQVVEAYDAERCNIYTSDYSGLRANQLNLQDPSAHIILPDVVSKEPLGPVVRQGDDQWFNIVKWVHFAMLNAEELGITSENVDAMMKSERPSVRRLLGIGSTFGEGLGLNNDWAVRIIRQVGNYGETFDRNLGPETPLRFDRGANALWTEGGLQFAPPIR